MHRLKRDAAQNARAGGEGEPEASIIIPCLNEEATIGKLLDAIQGQSFSGTTEVVIADGMSTDATRAEIEKALVRHPDLSLTVIDNPGGSIPLGLNQAIGRSRGRYIVRLDAHCIPDSEYVERCIAALRSGVAECVGGVWECEPADPHRAVSRAIARAVAHPIGVGDAKYRFSDRAAYVDTVPFGAFERDLLEELSGYDERLLANQDYELNARIRKNGGRVRLDPAIRSTYFPRASLSGLARQYFRYGQWKVRMLRLGHRDTLRWRQMGPPLLVASLIALAVASPFSRLARRAFVAGAASYAAVVSTASLSSESPELDRSTRALVPVAIAVMHISWGAGFLASLFDDNATSSDGDS